MSRSIIHSSMMNWACRTCLGNVVMAELAIGLPLFVVLGGKFYLEGRLTGGSLLLMLVLFATCGLLAGVLLWFGLTRPLLAQRGMLPAKGKGR